MLSKSAIGSASIGIFAAVIATNPIGVFSKFKPGIQGGRGTPLIPHQKGLKNIVFFKIVFPLPELGADLYKSLIWISDIANHE